jgi:type IV secretory pathway VirB10-like protein
MSLPPNSPVHSSTSPALFPCKTAPNSPIHSSTDTTHNKTEATTLLQPDIDLAADSLLTDMSTVIEDDAKMMLGEPSEHNRDRAAEFEAATRDDAETMAAEDSGIEGLQHGSLAKKKQVTQQEQNAGAQDATEASVEPKRETTPPRSQAAWVNEAVIACRANTKVRSSVPSCILNQC